MTIKFVFPRIAALAFALSLGLAACSGSPPEAAKTTTTAAQAVEKVGVGKAAKLGPKRSLLALPEGLYRLSDVHVEWTGEIPDPADAAKKKFYTLAAHQVLLPTSSNTAYGVTLKPLLKAVNTDIVAGTTWPDTALAPQMKVPLTIRLSQGTVNFEQLRLMWFCLKTTGQCSREVYLSPARSENNNVIHFARYIAKNGFDSIGDDAVTHLQSVVTGSGIEAHPRMWVELQSTSDEGAMAAPVRIRLIYTVDTVKRDEDETRNMNEESIAGPEPKPAP